MPTPHVLRRLALVAVLGGAAALAACTTPEPRPQTDARLPAAWVAKAATSADADAASIDWPRYFTDPRLQALIGTALANNRDLRIAAAKVEQARAEVRGTDAEKYPSLTGQVSRSSSYTPPTIDTSAASHRTDVQALASYEIDFWGRIASLGESARATLLASEDARREVRITLIAQVASTYFSLLEKDELVALARATLDSREQSLELAAHAVTIGGADEDERAQLEASVEYARGLLAQTEHQRNATANLLDVLVGTATGDALPAGRSLAEQEPGIALAPGLPSTVLLRRPDVMAAEARLAAANADIDAARAAYLPKVMLTAAVGLASPALAGLLRGGDWSYQPVLSLPIFDGGRTAATVDSARARRSLLVADYEKTLQLAFRDVADQLSARHALKLQLDAAIAGQKALAVHLAITRARYDAGLLSLRDVLEAQRALLGTRQTTISLRRAEQEGAAALYKALGGGSLVADGPPVVAVADAHSHP